MKSLTFASCPLRSPRSYPRSSVSRESLRTVCTAQHHSTAAQLRSLQRSILQRRNDLRARGVRSQQEKEGDNLDLLLGPHLDDLSEEERASVEQCLDEMAAERGLRQARRLRPRSRNSLANANTPGPPVAPVGGPPHLQPRSTPGVTSMHKLDSGRGNSKAPPAARFSSGVGVTKATGTHLSSAVRAQPSVESGIVEEVNEISPPFARLTVRRSAGDLPWAPKYLTKRPRAPFLGLQERELPFLDVFMSGNFQNRAGGCLPRHVVVRSQSGAVSGVDEPMAQSSDPSAEEYDAVLDGLNESQRAAVLADPSQACLVLAGPGSGKTRVLTHRIGYLVKRHNISPYKILAVTFTNKAAAHMKERVVKLLLGPAAPEESVHRVTRNLAVGTFHSIGARFLRKYGKEISIPESFDICDDSDSRSVISRILKQRANGKSPDSATVGQTRAMVSKLKNDRKGELKRVWGLSTYKQIREIEYLYRRELHSMKVLDFDDLLLETCRLLGTCPTVLEELQDRFEHVLVDEFQDTNNVQFEIVSFLTRKNRTLFVVGDADQSIYKFRGADSRNVVRFCEMFPRATEITLEQNYRSTACIVEAAQAVIAKDKNRPKKQMRSLNEFGNKVRLQETDDDKGEALFVVSTMHSLLRKGTIRSFSDGAVLYRTNAQSRLIEEACINAGVPYRLQSGVRFYERKEIKDLSAYVKIIANVYDNIAFRRIVNTPARGIGKKTVDAVEKFALRNNVSMYMGMKMMIEDAMAGQDTCNLRKKSITQLSSFLRLIEALRRAAKPLLRLSQVEDVSDEAKQRSQDMLTVGKLLALIVHKIGYRSYLQRYNDSGVTTTDKTVERLRNVDEVIKSATNSESVQDFLEKVALYSETDRSAEDKSSGAVSLMTLHSGKGLEFDAVFITGAEEGVIPMASAKEPAAIDEERRLLYVGMTRAKQLLYITWRASKLGLSGGKPHMKRTRPSRFLQAIPAKLFSGSSPRAQLTDSPRTAGTS